MGVAAFYNADLETARRNVGTALAAATKAGDTGAQIRILTILANGLVESKMYEQALAYLDNAIKIAAGTPDAGYQFAAEDLRIDALIGLGRLDAAQQKNQEVLTRARDSHRTVQEAFALRLAAFVAETRKDPETAIAKFDQAIALGEASGQTLLLAEVYGRESELHRRRGDLQKAEHFAQLASSATQASGDLWAVPQRLQTLAELMVAQGRY